MAFEVPRVLWSIGRTDFMQATTTETAITRKTRELCQTILEQPEFTGIRRRVDSFIANEQAKQQFQALNEKGEFLHHKQHQGVTLTPAEIADFEKERAAVLENPLIRGFLDAQQEMHKVQETVGQYVLKTFELGRVPEADDFEEGSCGPSCGCH
jgi:cell fate (sporulation/competence/biofilm development) regulator YlbF (YheA/YmcA/DUF963 family)